MKTELTITSKDMHEACAVSDFYQLLATSLQYPEKELVHALFDGRFESDAMSILADLSCSKDEISAVAEEFRQLKVESDKADELLKQMRWEYTRLFNDPQKPSLSLYESIFLDNERTVAEKPMLFINDTTLDVEKCYKEVGVSVASNNGEPADHIASELEFLMFLYGNKGQALHEQNNEKLYIIEQQIQQFEEKHIEKWVYTFFDSLDEQTETRAYKAISRLAKVGLKRTLSNAE